MSHRFTWKLLLSIGYYIQLNVSLITNLNVDTFNMHCVILIMKISLLTAPIACTFPLMQLSKLRYAFRHNIITRFKYFFGLSTTNIKKFTVTLNSAFYLLLLCTLCYMENRFMDKKCAKLQKNAARKFSIQVILWCTLFSDWLLYCTYIYAFWGYANDYPY